MLLHFIHSLSEFLGGNTFFPEGENRMENRLIEMFHSTTPETNKELILESLSDTNKKCQVVLATNALGMGIDAKGLYTCSSPQWSLQLFGSLYARDRAMWSRWDSESGSFVLPYRQQLAHIDSSMYQYLKNSNICRRHLLLPAFEAASASVCTQRT